MQRRTGRTCIAMLLALAMVITGMNVQTYLARAAEEENGAGAETADTHAEQDVIYQKVDEIKEYRGEVKTAPPADNGYLFAGWFVEQNEDKPLSESVATGEAYAKFVPAHILDVKASVSGTAERKPDTETKTASLRFATTVDSLKYQKIGFTYTINDGQKYNHESNIVYSTLHYMGTETPIASYSPTEFCNLSKYFKALTITDIPETAFDTGITVQPYWVTQDGTEVFGTERIWSVQDVIDANFEAKISDTDKDTYYLTLKDAVDKAENGAVVEVLRDSQITASIKVTNLITIKNVAGRAVTLTRGGNLAQPIFDVQENASLTLTTDNLNDEEPHMIIDGNKIKAAYETGNAAVVNLKAQDCSFVMDEGVSIVNNRSYSHGGVIATSSGKKATITINGGSFKDNEVLQGKNTTAMHGGILYVTKDCTADIRNATFESNTMKMTDQRAYGAVLSVADGAKVTIDKCTITGNTIESNKRADGGAIFVINKTDTKGSTDRPDGNVVIKNTTFTENGITSEVNVYGGAITVEASSYLSLIDCIFKNNFVSNNVKNSNYGGVDIKATGGAVIDLGGKIIAEIMNTSALHTLRVLKPLCAESNITMHWNTIGVNVKDKTVITFDSKDIMNASKEYFHLDSTAYELSFDENNLSATVVSGTTN